MPIGLEKYENACCLRQMLSIVHSADSFVSQKLSSIFWVVRRLILAAYQPTCTRLSIRCRGSVLI